MNRADAVHELKSTFSILDADINEIKKNADGNTKGFHVRASIRAYSALIEGLLFQMRHLALSSESKNTSVYNLSEKLILSEKAYRLNTKGEVEEKESFESLKNMVLFTLKQFPKIHGANFEPNTGDHRWEMFGVFIKIRNRVVHPKSKSDLELTHEEWEKVNVGIDWFYDNVKLMFGECSKADDFFRENFV